MTRRIVVTLLLTAGLLATPGASLVRAHEGHEHKVLGTVTMAAADHVMLKDKAGKEVTVYVTKATKVVKARQPMTMADVKSGMRVVITVVTEKVEDQPRALARVIELGAAAATTRAAQDHLADSRTPVVMRAAPGRATLVPGAIHA